jgi:pimeloyl-ACP methyl ester carboxylesterase
MVVAPSRREIAVAGGPVSVFEAGTRNRGELSRLLCVHGADGSAANWVDLATALAGTTGLTAIDLPGFGHSPLAGRRPTMADYADLTAAAATAPELGFESPPILACNSMGAVVGVLAAARHPGLFSALVLVAPAVPRPGRSTIDPSFFSMLAPFLVPGLMGIEARRRHALPPDRRVAELLELCFAPGNAASPEAIAAMVEAARVRSRTDHVAGWTKAFRSMLWWLTRRGAFHAAADRIEIPVLVVEGEADSIIPASSIAACLERHPSWSHLALAGVGHVPQLEAPTAVADAIREFVGRPEAPRAARRSDRPAPHRE